MLSESGKRNGIVLAAMVAFLIASIAAMLLYFRS